MRKSTIVGALSGALTSAALAALYVYRRSLPQVNGRLNVPGLTAYVEILRDEYGVPHLYAENEDDLFFAQGYVHAQDRLWQMEMNRRLGYGTLAELFGEIAFDTDRLLRTIGLGRAAINDLASVDEASLHTLEMYARGVNAYLTSATRAKRLPPEFTLLGFKPTRWQPLDSVLWGKVMAWNLSGNWDMELLRAAFIGKLGAEKAAQLEPEKIPANPTIIPPAVFREVGTFMLSQFRAAQEFLPSVRMGGGSNNWVVDGTKTISGKPLLANDPHLQLQIPGIWYENHLAAPHYEVAGVSFPGAPWVVIGHNNDIAWGFTNAFPDVQDLYVEKPNPDNPHQFEFRGEWEAAQVVQEEIRVKGRTTPHVEEIVITRHGPILNRVLPVAPETPPLALRWTGYEPSKISRATYGINRAQNWTEFCEAVRDWTVPSQNMVYADRLGNIGYYQPGLVPIRAKGKGMVPAPGWTGEHEWTGWIPHEELPHAYNPSEHLIATANNQVVGDNYQHFLTADYSNGYRAARITALLKEKAKLSPEDFARMQRDFHCGPAEKFIAHLSNLQPAGDFERRALLLLRDWDCDLAADSVAGGIYKTLEYFTLRRVFGDKLGDDLVDYYIGVGLHPLLAPVSGFYDRSLVTLEQLLRRDRSPWFDDGKTGEARTRDQVLALALTDAVAALRKQYGDDMSRWAWGNLHRLEFNHTLGTVKPLNLLFNRPSLPLGGDPSTVWQAAYVPGFPIKHIHYAPSWRQIMDLADWDNSRAVHVPGQSGHPASKHYADMIGPWSRGEYHPLFWSRDKVEAHAQERLVLQSDH